VLSERGKAAFCCRIDSEDPEPQSRFPCCIGMWSRDSERRFPTQRRWSLDEHVLRSTLRHNYFWTCWSDHEYLHSNTDCWGASTLTNTLSYPRTPLRNSRHQRNARLSTSDAGQHTAVLHLRTRANIRAPRDALHRSEPIPQQPHLLLQRLDAVYIGLEVALLRTG